MPFRYARLSFRNKKSGEERVLNFTIRGYKFIFHSLKWSRMGSKKAKIYILFFNCKVSLGGYPPRSYSWGFKPAIPRALMLNVMYLKCFMDEMRAHFLYLGNVL